MLHGKFVTFLLWLISILLHDLNLIFHFHILNSNLSIQIDIDSSVKRKLFSWDFRTSQVAQHAHYDCHEYTKRDQENQKVNERVKRSFSSELIEEALVFRNWLYFDSVSRHSRILVKTLTNVLICSVENGLDRRNYIRVFFFGSCGQANQLGSFQITKHLTFIFPAIDLPIVFLSIFKILGNLIDESVIWFVFGLEGSQDPWLRLLSYRLTFALLRKVLDKS